MPSEYSPREEFSSLIWKASKETNNELLHVIVKEKRFLELISHHPPIVLDLIFKFQVSNAFNWQFKIALLIFVLDSFNSSDTDVLS